jgi:hypothetical protein
MPEQTTIEAVLNARAPELERLANVTGVGIGKRGDTDVIKVFVTHKVPRSELRQEDVVPRELDGFAVDVDEIGEVTAQGS